jgi:hypothetical protein
LDWQKNSKTEIANAFLYFHVFLPGNEIFGPKKEKLYCIGLNKFLQIGQCGLGWVEVWTSTWDGGGLLDLMKKYGKLHKKKVFGQRISWGMVMAYKGHQVHRGQTNFFLQNIEFMGTKRRKILHRFQIYQLTLIPIANKKVISKNV